MPYFIITTFINATACGLCCILILVNNYKSNAVKNFALFNCAVAIWSFFYFLSMLATNYQEAIFYSRVLNTTALFIPPAFLSFCIQITGNKNRFIKQLLYLFLTLDILILPFIGTNLFIQKMAHILIFPFWPIPGPLFHLSTIEFFILIPLSLHLLKTKISNARTTEEKQLKVIYYSLLISFIGGSTNFLPCLSVPIIPFGNALISVFVFGFVYSIFKHQIMDIHVALSRSFVYAIIIFLISILYFSTTHITEIYLNELTGYKSFLFSFLSASITALAFIPLQNHLQKIIDKFFFKKTVEEIETENKLLKQEVMQTEKLKAIATLASGLAHEIKNPLTVLQTFTEYLPLKKNDPQFLEKYGAIASKEIARINDLVRELLIFAKPSPPNLQPINLNSLILSLVSLIQQKCSTSKIQIITQLDESLATISADPNQLQQALLNIILNAIDAMPNGGKLVIKSDVQLDQDERLSEFIITVSDTGTGISEEDLKYIFDPFFTKKEKGTGLGLAITQGIIEKHGGKIEVTSIINQGTIFTLKFLKD
jgi:signal transduction histidine kinase